MATIITPMTKAEIAAMDAEHDRMQAIIGPMADYVINSNVRCYDDTFAPEPTIRITDRDTDETIELRYDERDELLATVARYQEEANIGFETAFLAACKPYVESLA